MKFLKRNILFLLCLIWGLVTLFFANKGINERYKMEENSLNKIKENCLLNYDSYNDNAKKMCDLHYSGDIINTRENFYIKFSEVQTENLSSIAILCPLILIIISSYEVTSIFKSKINLSMLNREKYSSFLKSLFKCKCQSFL